MHTKTHLLGLALALAATAAPALAQKQAPPAPGEPAPFRVPETRHFTLSNGLEVTLVPYGEVPKASVQLITRMGNVDEAAGQVWLADVMADLMEEGTTTRTAEQIAEATARIGGALSVSVGPNTTHVSGDALSESVPELVTLVADVARNPAFPAAALDRVKTDRVRQLAISTSQPQQQALEKFRAVLYPGHPYGDVFPEAEALKGYTVDQIRDFYQRSFHAGRSHLYVVGRFDAAATEAAIRQHFGDWRGGAESLPSVPTPRSERAVYLVDKPGAVQSTIYMGIPVVDPSHPDYVALQVMDALLGGSFASRITSNIREQKGYTYSPNSSISSRYRDAYWIQTADVTTNVTGPSLKEIFYEIERLSSEPPSAEELRGIQNYLAGTFVLRNSSRPGIIGQLSYVDLHGLEEDWLESYVRRVYAVTPQDIKRVARTYLDPARITVVVVGDRKQIEEQVKPFGKIR
jgi:zinc protease